MPQAKILLLIGLAVLMAACSGYPNPDAVSQHISNLSGVDYRREGGATISKTALRLTRIGIAAADSATPEILENLKDFQIGVYRPASTTDLGRHLTDADFARYETVVALEVKAGEEVLLLSRSSMGKIKELLAIIDGRQKLTVVQLRGDLENILEQAVRMAFSRADRNDLTAPILDSLAD